MTAWANEHVILLAFACVGLYWLLSHAYNRLRLFYQGPPPIAPVHGAGGVYQESDREEQLRRAWVARHTAERKYVVLVDFVVGPEEDLNVVLNRLKQEKALREAHDREVAELRGMTERGQMGA